MLTRSSAVYRESARPQRRLMYSPRFVCRWIFTKLWAAVVSWIRQTADWTSDRYESAEHCFDTLCCNIYISLDFCASAYINKKLIRRWDSESNIFYDDIVHALQNTIDSRINSATDRRGYVLQHMFTKFSEITQCNGHYAVKDHSRSPILVPIESSYTTSY